ncbi:hypothetical protein SR99_22320 [Enterobacter hormaechei subsp. steigerwaltii]|uniref:carboxypeptidase-like regulatory domain-containing protein n=1 Tax=Enterobacter hormaechei TaxID=158836 RepID=UPI0005F070D3|nr:carboxypeptidase-like regulatory domain-containing protein [Enterobacter hormaechei]KJO55639.1 hypothetical protein SR99_22320 [Enterobacter hormaechei subsp. steigerwaltii]MCU2413460.1 carboxypeptidase-like regulatory domain-containing protein [Enterobacter hormaechei subsp. steigerwaltii]MCU2976016.1 carboxypeptidase-like regulatory domain-containing protein [Enterobacter hormaechei subsp. steigerwaltii]MCU3094079.1 carboxypeptidase-like regulatory domain-containing protein [Enterobacter h
MKKLVIAATAAALLSGCMSTPKPVNLPPFPQAEYDKLKLDGSEKLTGQAFLKTMGGDVKVAAGSQVILMPKTSYTDFQFATCMGLTRCDKEDMRAAKYEKVTIADAQGKFEFDNIAPGEYYVQTSVTWMRPSTYGLVTEGGALMSAASVKAGQNNTVMVTR